MALVVSSTTPLVLLDKDLKVQAASRSFCRAFALDPDKVVGLDMMALGDGEWNVAQLRSLLTATAAGSAAVDAYEMELKLAGRETRKLVLNAHVLALAPGSAVQIVLAVSDVTAAREAKRLKDDLLRDKHLLMVELQHRVANSLQIIASVLMQSVRQVQSAETRGHLLDAHRRVMSIATLQRQLASTEAAEVALAPYFTDLCNSIGASMIGDPQQVELFVTADGSKTTGDISVSLGLIVTELVINALKHAFQPDGNGGRIEVDYHANPTGWSLSVTDNGIGPHGDPETTKPGLGTGIVNALAGHLAAVVTVTDAKPGTRVAVVHG